ncbi:MAG: DUF4252 domain-containing protein [Pseudomonadota bacterium]
MKLKLSLAALVTVTSLYLAAPASAGPELTIPNFDHLRDKAVDSTDITIDGFLMRIAQKFAESDVEGEDRQALDLLKGIKSVHVRNFEFDTDDAYSKADVDSVRKQLNAPGWSALVQAHKREPREDVDVYVCLDGKKVIGLAVIASQPRQFTIVNIIGTIDVDKISQLEGQFGIPRVSQNR